MVALIMDVVVKKHAHLVRIFTKMAGPGAILRASIGKF